MSNFTNFAVFGSGALGTYIVEELLERKLSVRVLTRDASKGDLSRFKTLGVQIAEVDYDNIQSVNDALQGVEVVISTVGTAGLGVQSVVIKAAAGTSSVKVIVPSEYGVGDYQNPQLLAASDMVREKAKVREQIEQTGLKWVTYAVGSFASWAYSPYYGWNLSERTARLAGDGKASWSISHEDDIAAYVICSLQSIDFSRVQGGVFLKTCSYKLTGEELIQHAESRLGQHLTVERVPAPTPEAVAKLSFPDSLVPFLDWAFSAGFSDYVPDHERFAFKPKHTAKDLVVV